ncbi:MAG: glycosyltransferase family 1 protein [Acidobacteriota bacterium]|nr:glycosyltransferase family 1 protein [Acidobacteriota bacterium]
MRYILAPVGSAGDVHPFVAIGRRLRARGHDVAVVTAEPFGPLVERAGLTFLPSASAGEYDLATTNPELWHPRRGVRLVFDLATRTMRRMYEAIASLHEPGRTVLVGSTLAFAARVFEEVHRLPAATIDLAPNALRSAFQQPVLEPGRDMTRWPRPLKRLFWWTVDRRVLDPLLGPPLNAWRAEFGLPPVQRIFRDWVHSPQRIVGLYPDWFAPPQPDWPPQLRLAGFPLAGDGDATWPAADLDAFLAQGRAPLAFTAGSANRLAHEFFSAAVEAARLLGRRALLLTRFAEQLPAQLPAEVRHVAWAPFSTLLPRCAAVVHHGGIGTCAQGLAAGVPQLVVPMAYDQPDNAARLVRLGVGAMLAPRQFTGAHAAGALGALLDSHDTADACARWRDRLQHDDAVERVCDLLRELEPPAR